MSDIEAFYKIILVGDFGVGKTSLLLQFAEGYPLKEGEQIISIGSDFKTKIVNVEENRTVKLQLWDTAGQEKFRTITSSFYRATHGIIFVYDITNVDSFESIKQWHKEIERYATENIVKILVGSKSDLSSNRSVTVHQAKLYSDSLEMKFFETSAKSGENVEAIFLELTNLIYTRSKIGKTKGINLKEDNKHCSC